MPHCLSLKLTLGALNALAVIVVASVTLGIALSTSLAALGSIGERHARVLTSVARTETEGLFLTGTDAVTAVSNITQSQDWVYPSSLTDPEAGNETLLSLTMAARTAFVHALPEIDFVRLLLADGSVITVARNAANASQYMIELQHPAEPYNATTSNATNHLTQHWYQAFGLDDHRPLTPDFYLALRDIPSVRVTGVWNQFAVGTSNASIPIVYKPQSLLTRGGDFSRITGGIAPVYFPSVASSVRSALTVSAFVVSSITLDGISDFLRHAKSTPGMEAFAYDSLGYLLAATGSAPTFETRPDSTTIPTGCTSTGQISVADSSDAVIEYVLVCQLPLQSYDNADLQAVATEPASLLYPATGEEPVVSLALPESGRTFVATARVAVAFRGLEVYLMLLMPEADVLGDVISGRNAAIGVTCALVVLFTVVNVGLTWALLSPLSAVAERMHRAARFEDDATEESVSAMAEVAELQRAYYAMNEELNYISSFVPQSVLEARKAEREEAEGAAQDHVAADSDADMKSMSFSRCASDAVSIRSSDRKSSALDVLSRSARSTASRALTTPAALAMRNVSVVCGNIVALHAAVSTHDKGGARTAAAVAEELCGFVTATEAAVRSQLGVVTFHGDRFLATFNAARPCAAHASRASQTALELTDPISTAAGDATTVAVSLLTVSAGVATGRCAVGSVGSATLKTMSAVGPAVTQAAVLERYARAAAVGDGRSERRSVAVATQRTVSEMTGAPVVARTIDLVNLQGWSGSGTPTCVAELLRPLKSGADGEQGGGGTGEADNEWLYVVGDASADPRCAYNPVFAMLADGRPDDASEAFDKTASACPSQGRGTDAPTTYPPPPAALERVLRSARGDAGGAQLKNATAE